MNKPLLIVVLLLMVGCPRAADVTPAVTPVATPPAKTGEGVVEGHLRRSDAGDMYFDHRYRFRVQGPVGWTPRLNFASALTRVEFREPGNESPCWLRVQIGGSLGVEAIRHELEERGEVFYLNEIEDGHIAASIDLPGGQRSELISFLAWRGDRMEITGNFPIDRVSSCKPALDALVSSLRLFEGTAELTP